MVNTIQDLIDECGGASAIVKMARIKNLTISGASTVSKWKKNGIPGKWVLFLSKQSGVTVEKILSLNNDLKKEKNKNEKQI